MSKQTIEQTEEQLRHSGSQPISPEFRQRIVNLFEEEPVVSSNQPRKILHFVASSTPLKLAATITIIATLCFLSFRPTPPSQLVDSPTPQPSEALAAPLIPARLTSYKLNRQAVTPMIFSQERPMQLIKNELLDQLDLHDPATGKNISVTYPKTQYQLEPCNIQ